MDYLRKNEKGACYARFSNRHGFSENIWYMKKRQGVYLSIDKVFIWNISLWDLLPSINFALTGLKENIFIIWNKK